MLLSRNAGVGWWFNHPSFCYRLRHPHPHLHPRTERARSRQVFRGVMSDGGVKGAHMHKKLQQHGAKKFGKFALHHQVGNSPPFRGINEPHGFCAGSMSNPGRI